MTEISSQFSTVVFPAQFKNELYYRLNKYVQQAKNECETRIEEIKSEDIKKQEIMPTSVSFLSICAYYICPILAFLVVASLTDSYGMEFGLTIVFGLIAFTIVFFPIGFLYKIENNRAKRRDLAKEKEALREYKNRLEEKRLHVLREEVKLEEKLLSIHDKAKVEMKKYNEEFDIAVALTVEHFSHNQRVRVIADWFIERFDKAIIMADRSKEKAIVDVIMDIDVYADKIRSNCGDFTFSNPPIEFASLTEAFRLSNLQSPVHQAALCRVLLQRIQMNLKDNHPRDPIDGGKVEVKVGCEYAIDYAHGRIHYSATNHNHVPIDKWSKGSVKNYSRI